MSSQARPAPRLASSNAQVDAFESEDEWKNDLVMGMRLSLEEAINKAKKNLCKELERASPEDCTRLASKWNDKINAINGLVDGQYSQELEEERRKGFVSHTTSNKAQDELYGLGYHRDTEYIDNVEDYSYQRELNNEHNYRPWVAGQSAPPGRQAYHNSDGIQRNTVTGFDYPTNPASLQSSLPNINERTPDFRRPHVSVAPPIPIPTSYRETERASSSFLPLPPMVPFGHTSLTTTSNSEGIFGPYIQPPKHGSFLRSSSLSSESSLASLAQSLSSSSSSSSQFYRGDTQRDQFKETKKEFYEWPEQLQEEYPEQQQGETALYTENRNVEWYPPHYGSGGQILKREPDGNGAYMKFKEMPDEGNRTTARGREADHRVLTTATSYDTSSTLQQYDQNMQSHMPVAFPPPLISVQQPSYNTTLYDATTEKERSILQLAEETRKRAENIHEREAALGRREMEINQREENARKEKKAHVEASCKLADLELHVGQAQKYEEWRRKEAQRGHAHQRSAEVRNADKRKLMEQIHVILQQPNEQPAEQVLVAPNRPQRERESEDEMVAEAVRHLQDSELTDDLLEDPILREEQKFIWEQTKYHLKANETIQRKREERRAEEKRKEAAARQEYETRQREPSHIALGAQTRADYLAQDRRQHQREEARNMSAGRRYQSLDYDGDNIQVEKLLADPNVVEEQVYILKQLIERQARPIERRRQEERYLHDSFEDSNFGSSSALSSLGPKAPGIHPPPPPTRTNRLASTLPSSFKQHDASTSSGMDTLSEPTYNKPIPLTSTSSAGPSRPSVATQPISKASLDVPSLGKPSSGSVSFGAYPSPDQSQQFRREQARLTAEDARGKEVVSKVKKDKVYVQNTEKRRIYEQVSNIQEAQAPAVPKEDTRRRKTRTTERVATEISRQKKSEGPPSKSRTTRRAVDSTAVAAFAAITAPRRGAKRATVEDASDDEKDYRGETIPVDSRAIFEEAGPDVTPKPSMPPGSYNSTYNDTGERNEAPRGPSGRADTSEASWGGNEEMELSFENIWGR